MNPSSVEGNLRMMSDYLEIKVEIEEIVPYTNNTRYKNARNEVMHGEGCHEKRHGTCNRKCAAHSDEDEVNVPMMNSAARTLEHVLS